jgi:cobalt/nickel transport protein
MSEALAGLVIFGATASAHFNMLLPPTASARKGEALTLTYQWGHPFEHQLFDAPQPQSLIVLAPDGKKTELRDKLEKITLKSERKDVQAYRLPFTPEQRGDYVFVLQTPPIWMEEDEEFLQDTVKVLLHVQMQKGWDAAVGEFEFLPLTRPYGLRAGTVFQARMPLRQVSGRGRLQEPGVEPLGLVEIERYNPEPPKKLPPDEQITRTVKLDPNGVATTTLDEPGWWALTVTRAIGTRMRDGKIYPLRRRSTLWVFVDEARREK